MSNEPPQVAESAPNRHVSRRDSFAELLLTLNSQGAVPASRVFAFATELLELGPDHHRTKWVLESLKQLA